jgi:hypothetical protein
MFQRTGEKTDQTEKYIAGSAMEKGVFYRRSNHDTIEIVLAQVYITQQPILVPADYYSGSTCISLRYADAD